MCTPDQASLSARDPAEATITLSINGVACAGFANETILSCARRYDVYIPTLCELEDIDHTPGACRVCLVEILQAGKDTPQIVTACNTPVRDGMEVQTRSKKARDMQRLQVELLMADHLQDCATCIRHGSCELQDLAQFVGLQQNRFFDRERTEARPVDHSSPSMVRDMRRCVRCQRCVAICRYHQKIDALAIEGSGLERMVALRDADGYPNSVCVSCGQCVLVCPTGALGERDETDRALDYICDPNVVTVVQFAPAVRVAFGEEFGLPAGTNVEGQIIAACRKLGVDVVLDTNFAADVVIMEEGAELLARLKQGRRPTFTSCCPAWINFAEIHYPDVLPLLSSTKSPQQVLSTIAKSYLPAQLGVPAERIRVISIMPCIAKKDEAVRPQMVHDGQPETDLVLTTREFARLLRREGIDLKDLPSSQFDRPFLSAYSGAGAIFGTTGGVMEAAVRTIYALVNGRELERIELTQLRGLRRAARGNCRSRRPGRRGQGRDGSRPRRHPQVGGVGAERRGQLRLHRGDGLSGRLRRRWRVAALKEGVSAAGAEAPRDHLQCRPRRQSPAVAQQSAGAGAVPRTAAGAQFGNRASAAAHPLRVAQARVAAHREGDMGRSHHEHDPVLTGSTRDVAATASDPHSA